MSSLVCLSMLPFWTDITGDGARLMSTCFAIVEVSRDRGRRSTHSALRVTLAVGAGEDRRYSIDKGLRLRPSSLLGPETLIVSQQFGVLLSP